MRTDPPVSLPSAKSQAPAAAAAAEPLDEPPGIRARGADIGRGTVVRVYAGDAVEELVTDRLADNGGAGAEKLRDCHRMRGRGLLVAEPIGVACPGALAGDVVHVLDGDAHSGKRPPRGALDWGLQIMWNEKCAHADLFQICSIVERTRHALRWVLVIVRHLE